MAPEVLRSERHLRFGVDVCSLSVMAWETLSGGYPFAGKGLHGMTHQVGNEGERPEIPMEWPWEVREALEKGWAAKPEDRGTVSEFIAGMFWGLVRRRIDECAEGVSEGDDEGLRPRRLVPLALLLSVLVMR